MPVPSTVWVSGRRHNRYMMIGIPGCCCNNARRPESFESYGTQYTRKPHDVLTMSIVKSWYSNNSYSPHCRRERIVQSYSPGGALLCPHPIMLPWAHTSMPPNDFSIGSAVFAGFTVATNKQTDLAIRRDIWH